MQNDDDADKNDNCMDAVCIISTAPCEKSPVRVRYIIPFHVMAFTLRLFSLRCQNDIMLLKLIMSIAQQGVPPTLARGGCQ